MNKKESATFGDIVVEYSRLQDKLDAALACLKAKDEALAESHRALKHYQWYEEDIHKVRSNNEAALALRPETMKP